jgi:hypothetical protein
LILKRPDADGKGPNSNRRVTFRNAEEGESLGSCPVFEIPESWPAKTTERPSFYILKKRRRGSLEPVAIMKARQAARRSRFRGHQAEQLIDVRAFRFGS